MVKDRKIASPTENFGHRIIRVAATADQQSSASPASTSNSVTKEQTSSSNGSTKSNISRKSGNNKACTNGFARV